MKTLPISEFKATCLAVLEGVRRSGEPVLITKRGQAVAEIVPASGLGTVPRELGVLAQSARIVGDIVGPALDDSEWEALGG